MKVTKIALALGFALSMGLSAPVAMANGSELIKSGSSAHVDYQSRRINQAKSIVKQITDAVPDSEFIIRGDRMTDVEKQAYAFQHQNFRMYMLNSQIEQMKLNATIEKFDLMLASLAGADVGISYILFLSSNKMPFASAEEEAARVKFAKTPIDFNYKITQKYEELRLQSEVVGSSNFSEYMPESIAFDLSARINRIKANRNVRDYNLEKDLVSMEYDLNALAELDVADLSENPTYEVNAISHKYVGEIRDYINSLLLNGEGKHQIGKLKFEIDNDEMNLADDEHENIGKISKGLDDALDQIQ